MRKVWAAKLSAMFVSRAVIRVSFTPLGGRSVYCVTFGPIFAPSISTSILNSCKVSFIISAFCSTFPASAGDCFFSRRLRAGGFQLGSLIVTSATFSSAALSGIVLFFNDERFGFVLVSSTDESTIGTPAFSLNSAFLPLFTFSSLTDCNVSSLDGRKKPQTAAQVSLRVIPKTYKSVINIRTTYMKAATVGLTRSRTPLLIISPTKPPVED